MRSLNICGNSAVNDEPTSYGAVERFSDRLQKYLKSNLYIQHIDLSCLQMNEAQIETVITKGVKKAKSLLSFHLSGNNISADTLFFIRKALNIQIDERKENQLIIANHAVLAKDAKIEEYRDLRYQSYEVKQKLRQAEDIQKPLIEVPPHDRFAFVRHLGMIEIVDAHRWKQVDDRDCFICRKDAYCLFFWSESLYHSHLLKHADNFATDLSKLFSKQGSDEVFISFEGEKNHHFTRMLTL